MIEASNSNGGSTMLVQQSAPVAGHEFAPVFVALELSRSKWLVGVGTPEKWAVRRHEVEGGDLDGLLALLRRVAAGEERRAGVPVRIHVCFEAGRDGHWLHRALTVAGYEVYEIDPASVAVDRRARRVKSDGVDVDKLVRTLARLVRGERDACRVVVVPTPEEEDAKRPHREYERLVKERTSHGNRVKGLLFAQGVRDFDPTAPDRLKRLAELSIPPKLKAELSRECRRLATLIADIAEVEAEMAAAVVPSRKAKTKAAAAPNRVQSQIVQLFKLKGIGVHFSTVLGGEVYYRTFRNRRGVGQYIGLASSPFQSGAMARDQGIAKAGNSRARKTMIQLAWLWRRHQPDSALSKWFRERVGDQKGRVRRIAIVAMARKLAVALWRYLETGLVPEGAVLKRA
jgi:transposase